MKKATLAIVVILLLMGVTLAVEGANIHIRYFESADVILRDGRFQIFSFSALENEEVTIVAYGLEEGIVPGLTVLDPLGVTMAEDLNADGMSVAVAEIVASENGIYTFLVSRQTEIGGLMRVMLFEGNALEGDLTLLDTIDPFLPSRAYLVAGDEEEPIQMTLRVLLDEDDDAEQPPTVFASRGTELEVAPFDERVNPIQQFSWLNSNGDIFYTLNVRPLPEPLPTNQKSGALSSPRADVTDLEDIEITLGGGGDPTQVTRSVCLATAIAGAELLAGPGDDFRIRQTLAGGEQFEIVGENGAYVQVVDTNDPSGYSWILKSHLIMPDLTSEDCIRVDFVNGPPLNPGNRRQDPNFGGLPPGGNQDPDTPATSGDDDDSGDDIGRPPPPPPGSDTGGDDSDDGYVPPCIPDPQQEIFCDDYGYGDYGYGDYGYGDYGYGDYGYGEGSVGIPQ